MSACYEIVMKLWCLSRLISLGVTNKLAKITYHRYF